MAKSPAPNAPEEPAADSEEKSPAEPNDATASDDITEAEVEPDADADENET